MIRKLTSFQKNRIQTLQRFISDRKQEIDLLQELMQTCDPVAFAEYEIQQKVARGKIANAENQIDYLRGK